MMAHGDYYDHDDGKCNLYLPKKSKKKTHAQRVIADHITMKEKESGIRHADYFDEGGIAVPEESNMKKILRSVFCRGDR